MHWKSALLLIIGLVLFILIVTLLYGLNRWQACTKELRNNLEAARLPVEPKIYDSKEIEGLPVPVQRYFRAALKNGQSMVEAVSMEQNGTFNLRETGEQWKPFTSTQRVTTRRPGFDWEAHIQMAPGLAVRVHDAYIVGEGILNATLFGLVPLVNMRGTPEVARGELMRFFAETPWYPTALLPSQGVHWYAVDDSSAKATLEDGGITITMLFRFDEHGLIEAARAEARGRAVGSIVIPTPWEGRWRDYEFRDGMLIPLEGEVAWMLPEGQKPYWRGRIIKVNYEWAK